ncbi:MAG: rhomboid family intramembrane serine protease [Promethearchaeota archaeon]
MYVFNVENLKEARLTLSLVFLNVVLFVVFNLTLPIDFLLLFVQINENILNNYEIWRLITPIFLHADVLHLFSNSIALLLFGAIVETNHRFSKIKFLLIYFVSGIVGNLFSLILLPSYTISLGASGAIFGLVGVTLIMTITDNRALLPFALLYMLYFIIASLMPGINIWAHIFGLLVGLLFGYAFYYRKNIVLINY